MGATYQRRLHRSHSEMLIYDLFAGTGSATQAFKDAGHRVIKVELDPYFAADERDIMALSAQYLLDKYGAPDFIWASPPCTTFSIASCSTYWTPEGEPKNDKASHGLAMVAQVIDLVTQLNPSKGYIIENPRGMLRKQRLIQELERCTVTYCQYGDHRMKPTDLWGHVDNWIPRSMCKNGYPCHEAAPRGAKTGTQGIKGAKDRSRVPYELSLEILDAMQ